MIAMNPLSAPPLVPVLPYLVTNAIKEAQPHITPPAAPSAPAPAAVATLTAQAVDSQFASRPTVRSVVANLLTEAVQALYPDLPFDPAHTSLSIPIGNDPARYRQVPLLDVALEHLATNAELDFSDQHALPQRLVDQRTGTPLTASVPPGSPAKDLDMRAVELAIASLRANLKNGFAQALTQYLGQPGETGGSRWLWLSDTLKDTLRTAGLRQPGLDEQQRDTLDQVVRYPDRTERVHAMRDTAARLFFLDTRVTAPGGTSSQLSPDLLITRQIADRTVVLHVTPAGVVTPYDSVDAFGKAWGRNLEKTFVFDSLNWKRQEPDGNVFDTQAALIIDRQVQSVASIQLPGSGTVDDLEQRFAKAGNPAAWLDGGYAPAPQQLKAMGNKLPDWMNKASDAQRQAYRKLTLALASSVQRHQGKTFLEGVPDIRKYTQQQLQTQLAGTGYLAEHLEVTFRVPVGDLGSGYIEPQKMSLTDMALRNLSGLPKGTMEVRHHGQLITDPGIAQRLKDLVTQVDIGKHYPALLKRELLTPGAKSQERQALFAEQVPIQLAMQAQELTLKRESGFTARGNAYVAAVLQPGPGAKQVDGEEIVVRPLALLRRPDATPDVVANMFLIEPRNPSHGPHVLYRPLLTPPLQEFASREALLEALAAPGSLQNSVLAWLPDARARNVYDNGGFKNPHIVHFNSLNIYDVPLTTAPAPVTLAVDDYNAAQVLLRKLESGQLMNHLFESNAQALVNVAEGQSTSDEQSRWASYKEFGWLLFNAVLPVLRGPAAMVGWLLQIATVDESLKKLSSDDGQDHSQALVELLVNLGMLLLHAIPPGAARSAPAFEPTKDFPLEGGPSARVPGPEPVVHEAQIQQDPTTPYPGIIESGGTGFDFAFSNPRALTQRQLAHINSFKVPAPENPGHPIAEGRKKGLYEVGGKLYARIDNQWFRAAHDLDGVFIIDENNRARTSPAVKQDAAGQWSFDFSPKLRGGMPRGKAIAESVRKNAQLKQTMEVQYNQGIKEAYEASEPLKQAYDQVRTLLEEYQLARKKLHTLFGLSRTRDEFASQYETQFATVKALRSQITQGLETIKQKFQLFEAAQQKKIDALSPKKLAGVDDLSSHRQLRSDTYGMLLSVQRNVESLYSKLAHDIEYSVSGALMADIRQLARTGKPNGYQELIETLKINYEDRENLNEAAQASKAILDQWKDDSPHGNKAAGAFVKASGRPDPATIALKMKLAALSNLSDLALVHTTRTTDPVELHFWKQFTSLRLLEVARSQLDQQQYTGYSLTERKALLETIIDKYTTALSSSTSLQELNPAFFRSEYQARFVIRLKELLGAAEANLTQVVQEQQTLIPKPVSRTEHEEKPRNKRVFKTRDSETLVGTLRPAEAGQNNPIIDVLDPQTGQPIASYSEHPTEQQWVKIEPVPAARPSPPPPPTKSLKTLRAEAQQLIMKGENVEKTVVYLKRKLEDPSRWDEIKPLDWNDMLEAQARRLEETASQAEANHADKPETAALVERWRTAAANLLEKARAHCAEAYRILPPNAQNVEYLWRHGFVDIDEIRSNIPTKAGDVFTEYAISDNTSGEPLWYAHFHYPTRQTPRNLYTAAHLKLPSQRFQTQRDLIAEAGRNNTAVKRLVRAEIGSPQDQQLFLMQ